MDISVVVLTKNEESVIEKCIASAEFAKEVIVLDSGSSDATCEIAQKLGARIFCREFHGNFSEQRNCADKFAECEWIFHLDADETVSSELVSELVLFFASGENEKYAAANIPRKELIFGKWMEHGGWYPQRKLRLYRKGCGSWVGKVHERVEVTGEVRTFNGPILHDSYSSIQVFVEKFNRYSSIDAEVAYSEGKRFKLGKLLFQPFERFFGRYIIHKGYRDGFHGFAVALLIGMNYFLMNLKLWESDYQQKIGKERSL